MSEWTSLRSRVRELEQLIDKSLREYSYDTRGDFFEAQINDSFEQVEELLSKMDKIAVDENGQTAKSLHLDRHRTILMGNKREWYNIKKNKAEARDRQELLSSVRQITEERLHNANYLLNNEHDRLESSNSLADELLQRAHATKESLLAQRATLNNIRRRIVGAVQHMPNIAYVLRRIDTRRRREKIVLAALISVCILVFFYFR